MSSKQNIVTRSKSNSPIRSPELSPVRSTKDSQKKTSNNKSADTTITNKKINTKNDDILSLLSSSSFITLLIAIFLIRVLVIADEHYTIFNLLPHENKPHDSFNNFFPFYKTQHTNGYSNMLHYIGTSVFLLTAITDLTILLSYSIAMVCGLTIHPITIHSSHGLIEALAMFGTYLISINLLKGKVSKAAGSVMVAYACAWIGHFFLENNRPATFIYPTYSLMGDLKLWYDVTTSLITKPIPSSVDGFVNKFNFN